MNMGGLLQQVWLGTPNACFWSEFGSVLLFQFQLQTSELFLNAHQLLPLLKYEQQHKIATPGFAAFH